MRGTMSAVTNWGTGPLNKNGTDHEIGIDDFLVES